MEGSRLRMVRKGWWRMDCEWKGVGKKRKKSG